MKDEDYPETIKIPVTDSIDLHTFKPNETKSLVSEYLNECRRLGMHKVKVIHGKGRSVQKRIVYSVLSKCPFVETYEDALPETGGWGATIITLKPY